MDIDYRTWIPGLHALRDALLASFDDADLQLSVGGANPELRSVLSRWLSLERDYRRSLETLHLDWTTTEFDASTLSQLGKLFRAEDARFGIVDDYDVAELDREVSRPDLSRSRRDQIQAYVQSVLMMLATVTVYARAAGRDVPPAVQRYVG